MSFLGLSRYQVITCVYVSLVFYFHLTYRKCIYHVLLLKPRMLCFSHCLSFKNVLMLLYTWYFLPLRLLPYDVPSQFPKTIPWSNQIASSVFLQFKFIPMRHFLFVLQTFVDLALGKERGICFCKHYEILLAGSIFSIL